MLLVVLVLLLLEMGIAVVVLSGGGGGEEKRALGVGVDGEVKKSLGRRGSFGVLGVLLERAAGNNTVGVIYHNFISFHWEKERNFG